MAWEGGWRCRSCGKKQLPHWSWCSRCTQWGPSPPKRQAKPAPSPHSQDMQAKKLVAKFLA
eukprot:3913129-Prorocentrum_lima.AAC.1